MTLTSIPMFSPEFNLERKLCNTSVLSSHTAITTEITKLLAPQKKPSIAFESIAPVFRTGVSNMAVY